MRKLLFIIASALLASSLLTSCNGSGRQQYNAAVADSDTIAEPSYTAIAQQMAEAESKQKDTAEVEMDALVGDYVCGSTRDEYVFYSDHTGSFRPNGGEDMEDFKWVRKGSKVIVTYPDGGGSALLKFDKKHGTVKEYSEMYGKTLTYHQTD